MGGQHVRSNRSLCRMRIGSSSCDHHRLRQNRRSCASRHLRRRTDSLRLGRRHQNNRKVLTHIPLWLWLTFSHRTSENIPIYNYVSSPESPLLWGEYQAINIYHGTRFPLSNFFWSTNITSTTDKRVYNFLTILYHILPALFFDTLALVTGHKPRLLKMYKKIHKLISVINYFCVREWKFSNDNVQKLYLKLSPEDRKLFPVSMENVNWMMFFKNYFLGMRRYLLKDPDSTIQTAKIKLERIQWIDTVLITILKSCLVILGYYFFSKLVY